jgi:hypothetical protein
VGVYSLSPLERFGRLTTDQVFTFSALLFLSGYVLQQQTVRDIQAVIKPPPDPTVSPPPVLSETSLLLENINWKKVAYVQVLQKHQDICSTSILFAELSRQKSLAKRVILYPQDWDKEKDVGQSKLRSRNMRLLRKAASRYKISLWPIETAKLETGVTFISPSRLFSLVDFETVIYLSPSGVVLNAEALDTVFGLNSTSTAVHFTGIEKQGEPIAFLAKPSITTYQEIKKLSFNGPSLDDLATAVGSIPSEINLFSSTAQLSSEVYNSKDFKASAFQKSLAYMKFSDPQILGPEYDIPEENWREARPSAGGAMRVWEDMYDQFRSQRMGICGLDLEVIPKSAELDPEPVAEHLSL